MKPHIMFVVPYLKVGGQERQLYYIATQIARHGFKVTVVACERSGQFIPIYERSRLSVDYLDVPFSKPRALHLITSLCNTIRRVRPDIVVSRSWNTNILVALSGLITQRKTVLFVTGSIGSTTTYNSLQRRLRRWIMSMSQRIVCVSEGSLICFQDIFAISSNKLCVVHNGVDIDYISTLAREYSFDDSPVERTDGINILFVGRLERRKGLDILLEAISIIRLTEPELSEQIAVRIIGGGNRDIYETLCDDLQITSSVEFLGELPNPYGYMAHSDMFVLPSRTEGFPNVLLEAMALGMPAIASDCKSGPNEVIDHSINGWLVEPENPDILADAMIHLIKHPELRNCLGMNARKTISDRFSTESSVAQLMTVLNQVNGC